MSSAALWIHGPIISSSDLAAHTTILAAFGLAEIGRHRYGADEIESRWGVRAEGGEEVVLGTPGSRHGVRLIRFDPVSPIVIRDRSRGFDADALKVVDFYAPDFDAALAHLHRHGIGITETVAEYDLPEGRFRETHVWGPDEVVLAVLGGPADFFERFATIRDRLFSEPQSISGPVSDRPAVISYMESVLGLHVVHRYGITDDSFQKLVGTSTPKFELSAVNMGVRTQEPYFGLISYGMPEGSYASLRDRARLPHRGLVGATLIVADIAEVEARAQATGGGVLARARSHRIPGFGDCLTALIQGPNGACFSVVQA